MGSMHALFSKQQGSDSLTQGHEFMYCPLTFCFSLPLSIFLIRPPPPSLLHSFFLFFTHTHPLTHPSSLFQTLFLPFIVIPLASSYRIFFSSIFFFFFKVRVCAVCSFRLATLRVFPRVSLSFDACGHVHVIGTLRGTKVEVLCMQVVCVFMVTYLKIPIIIRIKIIAVE